MMDVLGQRVWIGLLAALAFLPFAGCADTSNDEVTSYKELKVSPARPGDAADSSLTRPRPAPPAGQKPEAAARTAGNTPGAAPQPAAAAKMAVAKAAAPPANRAGATEPGKAAGGKPPAALASQAARKVQLLIPERKFRPEGDDGALRVSYDDLDLLKVLNMDPVTPDAPTLMPAWLKNLDGRRIRIRGFMYPTFQQTGVHAFGLARDNQICCFGRNPKIYDVFDVAMRKGVTTNYIPNRPFDVVGVFHIRPEADEGKLYRLYEIDDAIVITK